MLSVGGWKDRASRSGLAEPVRSIDKWRTSPAKVGAPPACSLGSALEGHGSSISLGRMESGAFRRVFLIKKLARPGRSGQ